MAFKSVSPPIDFPELEKEILKWWYESGVVKKYLTKNSNSQKKFSFLDGPITANNPMGVHHAWGRTYKDLWQRYHTMKGEAGRYQNGFDCQGLWVEVEVEKELGFKSKKDIEIYGVDNFVNKCKDRVNQYSAIQTEQSKRLGYFMDWENSYFTMSDENNYAIWNFLKTCWQRGWLYKGHESIPWCPRCETAISQHEILTEDYKELVHESVYIKFPIIGRDSEYLLVWTTTPWTIPANVAIAIDAKLEYSRIDGMWFATESAERLFPGRQIEKSVMGKKLVGVKYRTPYDHLDVVKKVASNRLFHTTVATDPKILPIVTTEGTGLVHTAVSAGEEDFKLGKKIGLPMIPVIADNADYLPELGELAGKNAKKHPEIIIDFLRDNDFLFKSEKYKHRYPACWRCKAELVWKVADEWYIAMDKADESGLSLRKQMIKVARKIKWIPGFGLDRELDWLKNMHDWLISKKNRYWGLALPIYECNCGNFEVIGSKDELSKRAQVGWEKFADHSPHKPWVDEIKINCSKCGQSVSRIADVGNPWLDAGIVSLSTLPEGWFPADFITESFPGQFKNWFYSLIAMSTVMAKTNPFKTVLGYASLLAEDGRPMHKSWGNSIEFNEGADKIGADVMRWTYITHNPADNLLFGYKTTDDVRRRFHLIIWNIYNFFVTYANLDNFIPSGLPSTPPVLDEWIVSRLNQTIGLVTQSLNHFDAYTAGHGIEDFVNDLSLWYVRRSRDHKVDTLKTLHYVLITLSKILAPFTPFLAEEIYRNLTQEESVHLASWPITDEINDELIGQMKSARKLAEMGLSARKSSGIKVRQPLRKMTVHGIELGADITNIVKDELNIKEIEYISQSGELSIELDTVLDDQLILEGRIREIARQIQDKRKELGARLDQKISIILPDNDIPSEFLEMLKRQTLANDIKFGSELEISLL